MQVVLYGTKRENTFPVYYKSCEMLMQRELINTVGWQKRVFLILDELWYSSNQQSYKCRYFGTSLHSFASV